MPSTVALRITLLLASLALASACRMPAGDTASTDSGSARLAHIGALQGDGERSPFEGRAVTVQGVVTGNFVAGLGGFFMQDAAGSEDGDPATSDAVWVPWSTEDRPEVRRGDRLQVDGVVRELGESPQTSTALVPERIEVLGRGAVAATPVEGPPATAADWERREGMWLRVQIPLTVTGNAGLLRFGELETSFGERLRRPGEVHPPGPLAAALAADNRRRLLVLDDARRVEYPERLSILKSRPDHAQPLRAGSRVGEVEGLLEHRHGRWRLQLTGPLAVLEQAPRPPLPEPPASPSALRLAAFNLENLFNGDGRGGDFPTPRGAHSRQQLDRQLAKLVAMILALAPDVFAVAELENDGQDSLSAERSLATALNNAVGETGAYRPVQIADGASGTDEIRVGLFYRASRVRPLGPAVGLTTGPFAAGSRPPLVQAFAPVDGGAAFNVVAVHFKSKGGCPDPAAAELAADRDQGDGQGCWNAHRREAAQTLHDWLASDPTGAGSARVAVLGDFNAYPQEDPLRLLRERGWRDALDVVGNTPTHSYVFAGEAGRLDHALLSPAWASALLTARFWHANADENEQFRYTLEPLAADQPATPWRASDHDPLWLDLDPRR